MPLLILLAALVFAAPPLHPTPEDTELQAGIRQVDEGDYETAVITLDGVVRRLADQPERRADRVQANVHLGVAQVALGQDARGRAAFAAALRDDPSLRLSPAAFSPKVLATFDAARKEQPGPAAPAKSSHRTALVAGASAAAAAGVVAIVAGGGGNTSEGGVSAGGARFGTPVLTCPDDSAELVLPFTVLVDVSNGSGGTVSLGSVSTVASIVSSPSMPGEVGFSSSRPSTVVPGTAAAGHSTLTVSSSILCGNGSGDPGRVNEWTARLTLTTSAGVLTAQTQDRMTVNLP